MKTVCVALVLASGPPPPRVLAPAEPVPAPAQMAPGPARTMVTGGVVLTTLSVGAYAVMAAGLGLSRAAEDTLPSLSDRDDITRRHEAFRRGMLGNRLAIAGGIGAAVLMSAGVALIVVGRRRGRPSTLALGASRRRAAVTWRIRF